MKKKSIGRLVAGGTLALVLAATPAFAGKGKPNFSPALWGDGQVWGTKGTTELPAPNEHNIQAYDALVIIVNSNAPDGQMPVAEAAPGNIHYNGGRWFAVTAWWTDDGFAEFGTVPIITSYAEFLSYYMMGYIDYEVGPPEGGPAPYFQCPLLPVK